MGKTSRPRTSWVWLAVGAVFALVLAAVFVPSMKTPTILSNHLRAIRSLHDLTTAQRSYAVLRSNTKFACSLAALGSESSPQRPKEHLIDSILALGVKSGYKFDLQCADPTERSYTISAIPVFPKSTGEPRPGDPRPSGEYAFCSDQTGQVWYSPNGKTEECFRLRKPLEKKYRGYLDELREESH
jgi:hypothetical protein